MPELPEVETIVRRLRPLVEGQEIAEVKVLREKSFRGEPDLLVGQKVARVGRRAKVIRLDLDQQTLLIHLKMTGQLILVKAGERIGGGHPTADWTNDLPSKHTRVLIKFSNESILFFNDMRVFGWIRQFEPELADQELAAYGPDIIDENLSATDFANSLKRRQIPIKQAIMDGKFVAGVGNIYACDGLFLAEINPQRPANSLSKSEARYLLDQLRFVVNKGIKLGGATIDTYRQVDGLAGGYQDELLVYGREGELCKKCGGKIERLKQGGRSTFFCPNCQR